MSLFASPTATRGTHARLDTIAARLRSGLVSFSVVLFVTDTLPHFRMFSCSANHSFSPASLFVPDLGFPSFCMHPAHPPLLLQPRFRRHGILLTQETPSVKRLSDGRSLTNLGVTQYLNLSFRRWPLADAVVGSSYLNLVRPCVLVICVQIKTLWS